MKTMIMTRIMMMPMIKPMKRTAHTFVNPVAEPLVALNQDNHHVCSEYVSR